MKRVRAYRRVGTIDGIEVHRPPISLSILRGIPQETSLISRKQLEAAGTVPDRVGEEYQHVFIAKEDGRIVGVLQGFYLGETAYEESDLDELQQELFSVAAYIDAAESYEKRRGVGRKLVAAFEVWARERGAEYIAGSPLKEAERFNVSIGMEEGVPFGDVRYWGKKL